MIYPVGNGTREDFEANWYIAQGFGVVTNYGFHEGIDINLRTGGDTDLDKEIKAIANGRIVYYHYASHPTTTFGRHNVYRIEGAWGVRWIMNAHMGEQDFVKEVKDVNEGVIIGRIGKSGTPYAHDHMSIFKVDPATIGGIDQIARNTTDLNNWWEDPIAFINTWIQPPTPTNPEPVITDQTKIPQIDNMEVQAIRSLINDQKTTIQGQVNTINNLSSKITQIRVIVQ